MSLLAKIPLLVVASQGVLQLEKGDYSLPSDGVTT